jgi:signal transduction histidine kinase
VHRRRRDGTLVEVEVMAVGVELEGQLAGMMALYHDVSALMDAQRAAKAADRAKSQFLANMSHELRTPLNAIIGYSEILQEEAEEDGQLRYVPDLQKVQSAGRHLLSLINDILDLSKIEAGRMELFVEDVTLEPCCFATSRRPSSRWSATTATRSLSMSPAPLAAWRPMRPS